MAPRSVARTIPINTRPSPKSVVTTIIVKLPIDRPSPKSYVRTIPIDRQSPKSVVWTITISRPPSKSIVREIPISRQSIENQFYGQFQLVENL